MLTGRALGQAIESAIEKKGITQAALSRRFKVARSSVKGWIDDGRISKPNLFQLMDFFSDVVGAEHWGLGELPKVPASENDPDGLIGRVAEIMSQLSKGARHRIFAAALDEAEKAGISVDEPGTTVNKKSKPVEGWVAKMDPNSTEKTP